MPRRRRQDILLLILISLQSSVSFPFSQTTTNANRKKKVVSGNRASPPTADPKKILIWRYLKDCYENNNESLMPELFHPEAVLNTPDGSRVNYASGAIFAQLVPQQDMVAGPPLPIKPETLQVDIEFLPHQWEAIPHLAKRFPSEELQRFRATIQGERQVPDEYGSHKMEWTFVNIWRIVDGQCREIWPAHYDRSMSSSSGSSQQQFSKTNTRVSVERGARNKYTKTTFRSPEAVEYQKEWTPSENDLLKGYNEIISNVVSPQMNTVTSPKTSKRGSSTKQPKDGSNKHHKKKFSPDEYKVGLELGGADPDVMANGFAMEESLQDKGLTDHLSDYLKEYFNNPKQTYHEANPRKKGTEKRTNHQSGDTNVEERNIGTSEAFGENGSPEVATVNTRQGRRVHRMYDVNSDNEAPLEISEILDNMSSESTSIVTDALMQLGGKVLESDIDGSTRVAIFLACGHLRIVNAMQKYNQYRDIQYWGCIALNRMAYTEEKWTSLDVIGGHDGLRIGLVTIGALDIVLQGMENFARDTSLNREGIKAFFNIMYSENNLSIGLELGVVAAVVQSMKINSDDETVQSLGCRFLWYVCRDHLDGRSAVLEAKALGAIAAVLDNYGEDTESYDLAYQAMSTFLEQPNSNSRPENIQP